MDRMQKWLLLHGWWSAAQEASLRQSCRKEVCNSCCGHLRRAIQALPAGGSAGG